MRRAEDCEVPANGSMTAKGKARFIIAIATLLQSSALATSVCETDAECQRARGESALPTGPDNALRPELFAFDEGKSPTFFDARDVPDLDSDAVEEWRVASAELNLPPLSRREFDSAPGGAMVLTVAALAFGGTAMATLVLSCLARLSGRRSTRRPKGRRRAYR